MTQNDFLGKFDSDGRYLNDEGAESVVFATTGGFQYPGKLCFRTGLCVAADMAARGNWSSPDNAPISGIQFLLDFGQETPLQVAIDQGRVIQIAETNRRSTRAEFLSNFRIARNLYIHSEGPTPISGFDAGKIDERLVRAAIWLTPRTLAGFNVSDFREIGRDRQKELEDSANDFLAVARLESSSTEDPGWR